MTVLAPRASSAKEMAPRKTAVSVSWFSWIVATGDVIVTAEGASFRSDTEKVNGVETGVLPSTE